MNPKSKASTKPGEIRNSEVTTGNVDAGLMDFVLRAGRIINSGQTRSILVTGNVNDFFLTPGEYGEVCLPIVRHLEKVWTVPGRAVITYEVNGPIRFHDPNILAEASASWTAWRKIITPVSYGGLMSDDSFTPAGEDLSSLLNRATGRPTLALEILRQICICSRAIGPDGTPFLATDLIILIEGADLLVPTGPVASLNEADRMRAAILRDWFSDPDFSEGHDTAVLISESRSMINESVSSLPQLLEVHAPLPGPIEREGFLVQFSRTAGKKAPVFTGGADAVAKASAGLTIMALSQMLKSAVHGKKPLGPADTLPKVEEFIQSRLGEGVVEFKKPSHTLDDVIGYKDLKKFLRESFIPRIRKGGRGSISGAAVCGPIGAGKSFIFEAVAAELGMVVLVLKNIRSQWYGQTDVIFERLRGVLEALDRVVIFVDEADTQFGGVGAGSHETERRLTGKIQAMMSDPALKGRVVWLLMTARINLLSPDLRRPGRAGDLIIPVLDPTGPDLEEFSRWVVGPSLKGPLTKKNMKTFCDCFSGLSCAALASMRSELAARAGEDLLTTTEIVAILDDFLPPDIGEVRRYQELQALLNCTRKSLLPLVPGGDVAAAREAWRREAKGLEEGGN